MNKRKKGNYPVKTKAFWWNGESGRKPGNFMISSTPGFGDVNEQLAFVYPDMFLMADAREPIQDKSYSIT